MTFTPNPHAQPKGANAALILADGSIFWGRGVGAKGKRTGEVCFNTSLTGYQEILTDPSYAGQIINFTFPHIGNTGTNEEDIEALVPQARGLILRADITQSSNWRSTSSLNDWLEKMNIVGLCGVDTRKLTRRIRTLGAPNGVICHAEEGQIDYDGLLKEAQAWSGLNEMDLAKDAGCSKIHSWSQTGWHHKSGYGKLLKPNFHVVAIDYGAKHNILRMLANENCSITVVPATASAEEILSHKPDGIFLSNGPGDPAATGAYAVPVIRTLIANGKPIFGICLGHQLLALALGGKTRKMATGHRGANHPVKDLITGKVEITSQNHGFCVIPETLPPDAEVTHISLFDGTNEGIRLKDKPVFSVQYHPEASPGPQDSHYLFRRFTNFMEAQK